MITDIVKVGKQVENTRQTGLTNKANAEKALEDFKEKELVLKNLRKEIRRIQGTISESREKIFSKWPSLKKGPGRPPLES